MGQVYDPSITYRCEGIRMVTTATRLLTIKDAANIVGLRKNDNISRAIQLGELSAVNVSVRPGRPTWRIDPADLNAWLEARRAVPVVSAKPAPRRRHPSATAGVTKYF